VAKYTVVHLNRSQLSPTVLIVRCNKLLHIIVSLAKMMLFKTALIGFLYQRSLTSFQPWTPLTVW